MAPGGTISVVALNDTQADLSAGSGQLTGVGVDILRVQPKVRGATVAIVDANATIEAAGGNVDIRALSSNRADARGQKSPPAG